jgi:CBS domain containing-hemolysin-like protein
VLGLVAVVVLILGTGFFVAAEFSLVTVDRSRVQTRADAGDRRARLVQRILPRLTRILSGTQLGVTLLSVVLGFVAEPTVATVIEPLTGRGPSIAIAFALVTIGSMLVGELIPKNVAIARADSISGLLARPLLIYVKLFGPVIRLLSASVNATARRFGIQPREELTSVRTLEELALLIQSSGEEGTLDPRAFTLVTRTLRFNDKTAADALVPRVEVQAIGPDDTLTTLIERSVATGFSRLPVCGTAGTDLDDVLGVAHVKDVYRVPAEQRSVAKVAAIMTEPFVVPETRELSLLLVDLRTGSHLAVVVDEYGGTAGIITLEDVLEEIVGEIADEYDLAPPALTKVLPDGTYELPGGLHRDEVFEACGFEVPEGEYETLAGFVLDRLGHIPEVGDRFAYQGWVVEVAAMDRRRVATVRLTAPDRGLRPASRSGK